MAEKPFDRIRDMALVQTRSEHLFSPSVELVQALKADLAVLFNAQQFGDFRPGFSGPTLRTNQVNKRLQPTVIRSTATAPRTPLDLPWRNCVHIGIIREVTRNA